MTSIVIEFWNFLRTRKKFWMVPIFMTLVLIGLLLVFSAGSPVAPFIYTLF